MTISTTTSRQSYNGNGVTTIFSVPFRFFANTDLVVELVTISTGASTTLTLTTHYTVTGADDEDGGSLTMLTAPAVGERLVIRRVIGATQEVDYVAGDPFPAETHERALDRLTMLAQQGEEVNARALVFPSGDTASGELPAVATRANKLLGFDSSGGLVVSAPASGSAAELALSLASTASGEGAALVGTYGNTEFSTVQGAIDFLYGSGVNFYATGGDDTAALQATIDLFAGRRIKLVDPAYTWAGTITMRGAQILSGDGRNGCTVSYTGDGTAISIISASGTGTRIYGSGIENLLLTTSTGVTGVDADSLSESDFAGLTIAGFSGSGFKLHSSTSGGAVYNRFYNVKAQSCGTGFELVRDGVGTSSYTSDNTFIACRANICTIGFDISGGNHNIIGDSQIEVCTTGIRITEPFTATTPYNTIRHNRFENNTTDVDIGADVVETRLDDNTWVNGNRVTDNGTRTQRIGAGPVQHLRSSGYQIAGGSFRYVRTANGGTEVPHTVFNDASSINSPVTLEIQNPATSLSARALRVRYGGDAGTVKFGIVPISGKITDLSTTNGPVGSFTLGAAADTVVNNTAVTASTLFYFQPLNASACALVAAKGGVFPQSKVAGTSFTVRVGDETAAAGTEVFGYWMVN